MAIGRGDEGIFSIIEGIIAGIGEKAGALAARIGEGISAGGGTENRLSSGGDGFSISGLFGFGDAKHAHISAPQQQPEVQISAPVKQICRFEVDMHDLGQFSPPAVGNAARGADMGMTA